MKDEFLSQSEHDRIYKCFECGKRIIYERYNKRIASGELIKVKIARQKYVFHKKCLENVVKKFYDDKNKATMKTTKEACFHCGQKFLKDTFEEKLENGMIKQVSTKDGFKTFHRSCFKVFAKENPNWYKL